MTTVEDRRPEAVSQAKAWDKNQRRYLHAGFCPGCASVAAWGHQLGWVQAPPVCSSCRYTSVPAHSAKSERAVRWASGIGAPSTALHPSGPSEQPQTATSEPVWRRESLYPEAAAVASALRITGRGRDFTRPKTIGKRMRAYPLLVAGGLLPRYSGPDPMPWPDAEWTVAQRLAAISDRLLRPGDAVRQPAGYVPLPTASIVNPAYPADIRPAGGYPWCRDYSPRPLNKEIYP